MENDRLEEHKSLIDELNRGKELAKDLAKQMSETSSSSSSEKLVENILASYSEALSILSGRDAQGQCQTVVSSSSDPPVSSISLCNVTQSNDSSSRLLERKSGEDAKTLNIIDNEVVSLISDLPGSSSILLSEVTQSKDSSSGLLKRKSRRDKMTVKITGEASHVDEYCWRKYGQKQILGSKYPRNYYRCAHRHSRGCLATKQVHKSDDDPTISEVTCFGVHRCRARDLASKMAS